MVPNEVIEMCGEQPEAFWRIMQRLVTEKLPPTMPTVVEVIVKDAPMRDNEARKFEEKAMPFGLHAGRAVGEIPPDYLIFMAEGTEFTKQLKRYCASAMFFRRQKWDGSYE